MISDDGLYRLAVFFGSAAMLLIILYHFLEVNSVDEPESELKARTTATSPSQKTGPVTR
jgi:oligosaccharyl transferase complex subunit OST4